MPMSVQHTSPGGAGQRQEMILIRHAQSTANATGIWQGQLDFPLSEQGRLQAAAAGRALAGTRISAIYSSPLSRAFETAEIVAREASFQGEIVAIPDLMERHGGVLEGHTWVALPEEERWTFASAETDEEILARFERALAAIRSRHRTTDDPLVIISHGGFMRAFLRNLFGSGVLPGTERAPNASITRLLWDPMEPNAAPQLLELASTNHLSPEEERQARTRAE